MSFRRVISIPLQQGWAEAIETQLNGMPISTWIREIAIRNELERRGVLMVLRDVAKKLMRDAVPISADLLDRADPEVAEEAILAMRRAQK